jgi:hypothetical protein
MSTTNAEVQTGFGHLTTRVVDLRKAVDAACKMGLLSLPIPADCPETLARRLDDYNAKVLRQQKRHDDLGSAVAAFADRAAAGEVENLVAGADKLRIEHYAVYKARLTLRRESVPVLQALVEELARRVPVAEAALEQIRKKSRAALLKSGFRPQAAFNGWGQHPNAEDHQINYQVECMEVVVEARNQVKAASEEVARVRQMAGNSEQDIATLLDALSAVGEVLVGKIG